MVLVLVTLLPFGGCKSQKERIDSNIQILKDKTSSERKRQAAVKKLAKIGEPAIPALPGCSCRGSRPR
jgi:hypothetical protein